VKPSCKGCGQEIRWEGFDFTIHEHLCGICLKQVREGVRRERERIVSLLKDNERDFLVITTPALESESTWFKQKQGAVGRRGALIFTTKPEGKFARMEIV